nr:ferredoxin [Gammaproteobacteria bacterium]
AEFCGMLAPTFTFQYPHRQLDASHDDFILDLNRCINCELCVRASRDVDGKSVFAIAGRGAQARLVVNSGDGQLGSSEFAGTDRAASVCPVGVILPKHKGFEIPIGQREFDVTPIQQMGGRDDG